MLYNYTITLHLNLYISYIINALSIPIIQIVNRKLPLWEYLIKVAAMFVFLYLTIYWLYTQSTIQ